MSKQCVIFDIDGTLADCSHRLHYVKGLKKDWPTFFSKLSEDTPVESIMWLLQRIALVEDEKETVTIFITTGRPEEYRETTVEWLNKYLIPYDALLMRPTRDYRADHIIKKEILDSIKGQGFTPILVVDDRQSVVDMWRAEGLTCLQCKAPQDEQVYPWGSLFLMVGPSGAGKSNWFARNYEPKYGLGLSSDEYRGEICGNIEDQSKNDQVFSAIRAIALARLKHGLPVMIDATHIKRAARLEHANLVPQNVSVTYIVCDRPLDEKLRDRGWRPEWLIHKHHNTFMSNLKDILKGDDLPNVTMIDQRTYR